MGLSEVMQGRQGTEERVTLVLPLFQPIYDRFEQIDTSADEYQGREGAIRMMELAEQDKGLMDLVSLVGSDEVVNIRKSSYETEGLFISREGFFFYHHDGPDVCGDEFHYEVGEKDRIMDKLPDLTAENIRDGISRFIGRYSSHSEVKPDKLAPSSSSKTGKYAPVGHWSKPASLAS